MMVRNTSELVQDIATLGMRKALARCFGVSESFLSSVLALCPESLRVAHTTLRPVLHGSAHDAVDEDAVDEDVYLTVVCLADMPRTYMSDDFGARLRFDTLFDKFYRTLLSERVRVRTFSVKLAPRRACRAQRKLARWRRWRDEDVCERDDDLP